MEITNRITANAKRVREQEKRMPDTAANSAGVPKSMLPQIKKADVIPTIPVLRKIVNGYTDLVCPLMV